MRDQVALDSGNASEYDLKISLNKDGFRLIQSHHGHAAELGKVARLGVEPLGRLGSHLTECLAYNFL